MRATLTMAANGSPIAGQTVAFTGRGREICRARSDARGQAGCTASSSLLIVLIALGYTARFGGTDALAPSPADGRVL